MKAKIRASSSEIFVKHCYPEIVDDTGLAGTDPGLLEFVFEGLLAIVDFIARKAVAVHIDGKSRCVRLSEKQRFKKLKEHSFDPDTLREIVVFTSSRKRLLLPAKKIATLEITTKSPDHPSILLIRGEPPGKVAQLASRVAGLLGLPLTERAAASS